MRWRPTFWQLNLVGWMALAVVVFVRLTFYLSVEAAAGLAAFHVVVGVTFTALMRWAYRAVCGPVEFTPGTAAFVIGLSLAATLVQSTLALWVVHRAGWFHPLWTGHEEWLLRVIFFWLVYMVWSLLFFWLKAESATREQSRRANEAVAEAARMEIRMLRSQLDPHFLFNALNGVQTLIARDPGAAGAMVHELADYLRYTLDHRQDMVVPLGAELEALAAYVHVERARFGDGLEVAVSASAEARRFPVPCFLLQPLVENAVKHSFESGDPPWTVKVGADVRDGRLHVTVWNGGRLASPMVPGVGLGNLRRRLELVYPDGFQLDLSESEGGVRVGLVLEEAACSGSL